MEQWNLNRSFLAGSLQFNLILKHFHLKRGQPFRRLFCHSCILPEFIYVHFVTSAERRAACVWPRARLGCGRRTHGGGLQSERWMVDLFNVIIIIIYTFLLFYFIPFGSNASDRAIRYDTIFRNLLVITM